MHGDCARPHPVAACRSVGVLGLSTRFRGRRPVVCGLTRWRCRRCAAGAVRREAFRRHARPLRWHHHRVHLRVARSHRRRNARRCPSRSVVVGVGPYRRRRRRCGGLGHRSLVDRLVSRLVARAGAVSFGGPASQRVEGAEGGRPTRSRPMCVPGSPSSARLSLAVGSRRCSARSEPSASSRSRRRMRQCWRSLAWSLLAPAWSRSPETRSRARGGSKAAASCSRTAG